MDLNESSASWSLPVSKEFVIRDTLSAGRAVFCTASTMQSKLLLTTSTDLSPVSYVILRAYSKEVCAWCFRYDRGREWKTREGAYNAVFCSEACQQVWFQHYDNQCQTAIYVTETFTKQVLKRQQSRVYLDQQVPSTDDTTNQNELEQFWNKIDQRAQEIVKGRRNSTATKSQRALTRKVQHLSPDTDILSYILSGVITAHIARKQSGCTNTTLAPETLIPSLFKLMPDDKVFTAENPMTQSPLEDYAYSYLVLLTILPLEFLDLISTSLVVNLASRAAHNAFSIRPEGVTDGEQSGEFLGWGVWPEASFFNHSCRPNVKKTRSGRKWSFSLDISAGHAIKEGQQLCITYLGGDENDLNVAERRNRLQEQWGFWCQCTKCIEDSGESVPEHEPKN